MDSNLIDPNILYLILGILCACLCLLVIAVTVVVVILVRRKKPGPVQPGIPSEF